MKRRLAIGIAATTTALAASVLLTGSAHATTSSSEPVKAPAQQIAEGIVTSVNITTTGVDELAGALFGEVTE